MKFDGIEIKDATIMELARTADADAHGYLISTPSLNRRLMAGHAGACDWYLWMESNGDPTLVHGDNGLEIAWDMSDAPAHELKQGYKRIADGIAALREHAGACDSIAWWEDWLEDLRGRLYVTDEAALLRLACEIDEEAIEACLAADGSIQGWDPEYTLDGFRLRIDGEEIDLAGKTWHEARKILRGCYTVLADEFE